MKGGDQTSERNLNEAGSSHRNMEMKAEKKRMYAQAATSFLATAVGVFCKKDNMSEEQFIIIQVWRWKKMPGSGTKLEFNNRVLRDGLLHSGVYNEAL